MKAHVPPFAAALFALAAFGAGPAAAQSFNCNYAKLPTEVAICQDGELASSDEELATEYAQLINGAPGWAVRQIKNEQKAWLAERNACGYDMQCIMGEYRFRLQQFGEWRDQLGM